MSMLERDIAAEYCQIYTNWLMVFVFSQLRLLELSRTTTITQSGSIGLHSTNFDRYFLGLMLETVDKPGGATCDEVFAQV